MKRQRNLQLDRLAVALLLGTFLGMELKCSFSFTAHQDDKLDPLSPALRQESSLDSLTHQTSTDGYQLAYNQSYGYFFNSISDEEWKMRQAWARNATFNRYKGHPRRQWDQPNLWYYNNFDPLFSCPFQKRVRGIGDGPKWTCDPHQLKRISESGDRPCLLYSVGSNGNYQWEDGMHLEAPNCQIHVFDYSENYTRPHNRERNIHFHQWGLKGSRELRTGSVWKTFPEIVRELGHEGKTIDILKIDCEGCEWESFQDWIGHDIRQILVETHTLPNNKTRGLMYFDAFVKNDFLMYSKEVNPWGGGQYVEFSYIKLHPDFLEDTFKKAMPIHVRKPSNLS